MKQRSFLRRDWEKVPGNVSDGVGAEYGGQDVLPSESKSAKSLDLFESTPAIAIANFLQHKSCIYI